jgi:hypothetical protein
MGRGGKKHLQSLFMEQEDSAGIVKQSVGARNRVGIGLSYRPARLHRLAELIPWNTFWAP